MVPQRFTKEHRGTQSFILKGMMGIPLLRRGARRAGWFFNSGYLIQKSHPGFATPPEEGNSFTQTFNY
ncbi:hypothetical protein AM493_15080 [Flavobacterium akiainvivens]|uniref:Uncharacterized protein n=1 Tax=Flavobacterium akiainvivens TaxID=1202724 RepID=A0A0M9VJ10_9FLAO|nr:hypothetical protein AM493_15080 [Flavobacterium akiainvivens]